MFISNHTSTNENYTLSLHDALPISLIGDINTTDSKDTLAILPLATREATPSAAWSICATTQPAVISPCRLASLRVGIKRRVSSPTGFGSRSSELASTADANLENIN